MKHVKSLYILSESCLTSFPIDHILCVKVSNKQIEITFIDGQQKIFNLRLTELLTCVFELTNYSQFFFAKEGLLFNPLHTYIVKHCHASHIEYEIVPKINFQNTTFLLPAKDMVTQLAKSKLIVQNITDHYLQL